eukprot:GFUD01094093.1.p1 GENE.GFUD01094093.1~~GFUD01094093.1.p1  ORF type:complete len:277 (+),score=104.37 GFUD01094093.1:42-872(+)
MSATTVKDLPKELLIADNLKGELLQEHNLKHTEAEEKNSLPTAEDLKQEKTHQNIITGIEGFKSDSLKPTETMEKIILPGEEDIKTEKTIQGILHGVEGFENDKLKNVKTREPVSPCAAMQIELARDSSLTAVSDFDRAKLKKAETTEKNPLPSSEAIAQEMEHINFIHGVEGFENDKLRNVKTREPFSPSTVMQIELARDSSLTAVGDFDRTKLKKAETSEKNSLPSTEAIAQEMEHIKFKVGIEKYDKTKLSHTETLEKNLLPTQEIIAMEKSQ